MGSQRPTRTHRVSESEINTLTTMMGEAKTLCDRLAELIVKHEECIRSLAGTEESVSAGKMLSFFSEGDESNGEREPANNS